MAKKQKYGPQWSNAAEQAAANARLSGGTQQGQYGVPGEQVPPAPPPPGGGGGAGGAGRPSGTPIRDLFNQMGGRKGAHMTFKEFKDWYKNQSKQVGGDLSSFLSQNPDIDVAEAMGPNTRYGPGATFSAGSDISSYLQPSYLSDEGELATLNRELGTDYSSLTEMQNAYALGAGMAGVEQFRQNLGAGRGNLPDWLTDVSSQDIRYDDRAWEAFYGGAMGAKDPAARLAAQQELVPEWASAVDKALQGQVDINREGQTGIPFGFELMMDPNINLGGGGEPLWEGAYPASLQGFHHNQAGEGAFMAGLSMEEVMRDLWPILHAQTHQQPGQAAPFEAGLSFGSPVWDEARGQYQRSPLMGYGDEYAIDPDLARLEGFAGRSATETELAGPGGLAGGLYNRWAAHGMPGTADYNAGMYGATLTGGNPSFRAADFGLQEGDPRLQQIFDSQEQSYWSNPIYDPWQNLPENVRKRFQALINAPLGSGGQNVLTAGYS